MPKCAYTICSESGAQDQVTESVSIFNVIEKLRLAPPTKPNSESQADGPKGERPFSIRVTSVWFREESDPEEGDYEAEIILRFPDSIEVPVGEKFNFKMKMLKRIYLPSLELSRATGLGFLEVVCRVRQVGKNEWHSDSASILLYAEGADKDEIIAFINSQRKQSSTDESSGHNSRGIDL